MTDIAQGNHAKLILKPGDVYRISSEGVATATPSYGAPNGDVVANAGYRDIGPFAAPAKFILTATSGRASYQLLQAQMLQTDASGLGVATDSLLAMARSGLGFPSGALNVKKSNTAKTRAALDLALSNGGDSIALAVSDSSMAGTDAGPVGTSGLVGAKAGSWFFQLMEYLNNRGFRAKDKGWGGTSGAIGGTALADALSADTRVTVGATVTFNSNWIGPGGAGLHTGTNTGTGWVRFTPGTGIDKLEVGHMISVGTGSFTVHDQAGTLITTVSTQSGASPQGYKLTYVDLPAGTTYVTLTTTGVNCVFYTIAGRDSTKRGIHGLNCGISGINSNFFTQSTAGNQFCAPRQSFPLIVDGSIPGFILVSIGFNNINAFGQTLADTLFDFRVLLALLKALPGNPDVWYVGYTNLGSGPGGVDLKLFQDSLFEVAIKEFDCPAVDQRSAQEDPDTAVALGLMKGPTKLHNMRGGQARTARVVGDVLLSTRTL